MSIPDMPDIPVADGAAEDVDMVMDPMVIDASLVVIDPIPDILSMMIDEELIVESSLRILFHTLNGMVSK